MTVYLVRHAVAVGRSSWDGDDRARPLTRRGERQAAGLVELLAGGTIKHVHSSPAVRCRDTVAPLAAELGLEVHDEELLAEGARPKEAIDLLHALATKKADSVLCAHGDLIPEILRKLHRDGVKLHDDLQYAKGSTWRLDVEDDRVVAARYLPPPA